MFKEINIGGYVLRFYPTDNKGWMCGITDKQLTALMSITTLFTNPVKELTDEEILDELVKVKHTWVATTSVWYEFEKEELKKAIRAILRKAQEK